MKVISIKVLKRYAPTKTLPKQWEGSALAVLNMKHISASDKLRVICRENMLDAGLLRLFALEQAKTCRKAVENKKEFVRILGIAAKFAARKHTKVNVRAADRIPKGTNNQGVFSAWMALYDAIANAPLAAAQNAANCAGWTAALRNIETGGKEDRDAHIYDAASDASYYGAVKTLKAMIRKEYAPLTKAKRGKK